MQEHIVNALVLSKIPAGEMNARVTLYTEQLGKVVATARSVRKLTSKLAAHTEPLMLIKARLVETNGFQIVDALCEQNLATGKQPLEVVELLEVARLIGQTTHVQHADADLWSLISSGNLLGRNILRCLGFDPDFSTCHLCGVKKPAHFVLREGYYLCAACLRKVSSREQYFTVPASVVKS